MKKPEREDEDFAASATVATARNWGMNVERVQACIASMGLDPKTLVFYADAFIDVKFTAQARALAEKMRELNPLPVNGPGV